MDPSPQSVLLCPRCRGASKDLYLVFQHVRQPRCGFPRAEHKWRVRAVWCTAASRLWTEVMATSCMHKTLSGIGLLVAQFSIARHLRVYSHGEHVPEKVATKSATSPFWRFEIGHVEGERKHVKLMELVRGPQESVRGRVRGPAECRESRGRTS